MLVPALAAALLLVAESRVAQSIERSPGQHVTIQFGMVDGRHVVTPETVELEHGKTYELVIANSSGETHYLVPKAFSAAVKTTELTVAGGSAKTQSTLHGRARNPLASAAGRVDEIVLGSGGEVRWQLVAMVPGTYSIECCLPGHAIDGTKATIIIR
jgi:uncharacterized cupredoxin-like copper-binding protein